MTRLQATLWLAVLAGFPIAGCSRQGVTVTGRLLNHGQPYQCSQEELSLIFLPIEQRNSGDTPEHGLPERQPPSAVVASVSQRDATFKVFTPERKGIPPGVYRISLYSLPYQSGAGVGSDKFKGKFVGERTPLLVDLSGSKKTILIDVGTETATVE